MGVVISNLDKQINNYLSALNIRQKKALLTLAKTFAEAQTNDYTNEFKAELDSRYEEYINDGVLVNETDVNTRITDTIKVKAKQGTQ